MTTQELSADEKATVAAFGIHDEPTRVKVWCINWPHPDAPHAAVHVIHKGELGMGAYFATWTEAIDFADRIAHNLRTAAGKAVTA